MLEAIAATRVNVSKDEKENNDENKKDDSVNTITVASITVDTFGVDYGVPEVVNYEENMEKVRVLLGLPEEVHVFALFALGYPAEHREQQDRFKPERIHFIDE